MCVSYAGAGPGTDIATEFFFFTATVVVIVVV